MRLRIFSSDFIAIGFDDVYEVLGPTSRRKAIRLYGFRRPPAHGYAAPALDNADAKLDRFAVKP